jgi:hypothetical protein
MLEDPKARRRIEGWFLVKGWLDARLLRASARVCTCRYAFAGGSYRSRPVANIPPRCSPSVTSLTNKGAIFAPMNIFNPDEDRWNMFYIGYTCHPGQGDGAIYRLVSQTAGRAGIAGPYPADNATIILDEEMGHKESWEGHQGDDSFHAR